MLQIIYGRAGTGKTYTVFEKIKQDVENGRQVVLLVPEQFTFESERNLLHTFDGDSSTNVSVLSFTRLYDEVARFVGGRVADLINDSHKAILMGQALSAVGDDLKLWSKYTHSPRFIKTMLSAVNEMKLAAVTPDELREITSKIDEDYLKNKIDDLALVYGAFDALLGNKFLDPQDNETRLAANLLKYKFFENKTVYIDAFKNFTGGQYKILDRILSQADNVTVCLTLSDIESKRLDLFHNVRNTAKKICELANKNKVKVLPNIELGEFHYSNEAVARVESAFANALDDVRVDGGDNVVLCACETPADEAEFAARTIRGLVRDGKYRYKDFVIICRNAEDYKGYVEQACLRNDVFCFSDRRHQIDNLPLTVFINSLLSLLNSFDTDTILCLLKTGLGPLSEKEIYALENYIYIWDINGNLWNKEWNMNPLGLTDDEFDAAQLANLEEYRQKTVALIKKFRNSFCGTPSNMVTAIVNILDDYKVSKKLKEKIDEYTEINTVTADDIRGGYDAVMGILDSIVRCLPDKEITERQFIDSWDIAVSFATIGNIPQMLDEVTFGSADRIKPSRPKVAFVLGANAGVFPQNCAMGGVFASRERTKLKDVGLSFINTDINAAIDEDFLVYSSLSCAKDKVYVSYSKYSASSGSLEPSSIVDIIKKAFAGADEKTTLLKQLYEPRIALDSDNLPQSAVAAASKMCEVYNASKFDYNTIKEALDGVNVSVEDYIKAADKTDFALSPDVAEKLYGQKMNASATKIDTYYQCKFKFFCKYGLSANKIEAADFNVLQRGTITHYVLENVVNEYGKKISTLSKDECDAAVDKYLNQYFDSIAGFADISNARIRFLIGKIALIIKDVVSHLAREFAQSDFNPDYCELKIKKIEKDDDPSDKTVPPYVVDFDTDGKIFLKGSIDRVDTWGDYLRVIDYKTGTKVFSLPDILFGLNLQLLVYLFCIVRGKDKDLSKLKPAGVLYMPSKREKEDTSLTMNGLVLDEEIVYSAMDKDNEGVFIPKHEVYANDSKSTGKLKGETKGNTYISSNVFDDIFDYIELLLKRMGKGVHLGDSSSNPVGSKSCKYCDYYAICCYEKDEYTAVPSLNNSEVMTKIREEISNGI